MRLAWRAAGWCHLRHIVRNMATWRSGDAADCKSVYPGSIPGVASSDFGLLPAIIACWLWRAKQSGPAEPYLKPAVETAGGMAVARKHDEAERDHPEAEYRQEAEGASDDEADAGGCGHGLVHGTVADHHGHHGHRTAADAGNGPDHHEAETDRLYERQAWRSARSST